MNYRTGKITVRTVETSQKGVLKRKATMEPSAVIETPHVRICMEATWMYTYVKFTGLYA